MKDFQIHWAVTLSSEMATAKIYVPKGSVERKPTRVQNKIVHVNII